MIIDKMLKEGHIQEQDVTRCQIFNFEIPVQTSVDNTDEMKSATLAFNEGFLNLPAPKCIFVGNLQTPNKSELIPLIFKLTQSDEQGDIDVHPFYPMPNGSLAFRQGWITPFKMEKCHSTTTMALNISDDAIGMSISKDNLGELTRTAKEFGLSSDELMKGAYGIFHTFVTVSLGRLITDGIKQEKIVPSEKLNKKRISRGYPEMVSHTVVKLKPCRPPMGRSGSQGEYFTPKRYHFRRGHVRHFKNGQKTWVRSCFVGDISQGKVEHQYKVSV